MNYASQYQAPEYVGDFGQHWYLYPTALGVPTAAYDIFGGDDKASHQDSHGGGGGGGGSGTRHRRGGGGGGGGMDWSTIAIAGIAVAGVVGLVYALKK